MKIIITKVTTDHTYKVGDYTTTEELVEQDLIDKYEYNLMNENKNTFDIYVKEKDVMNIWGGSIDLDGENYVCLARNVPMFSDSVVFIERD